MIRSISFFGMAALALAAAAGCQKSHAQTLATVPIEGTVTLDGNPLEGAEVIFITAELIPFTAATAADGSYHLASLAGGKCVGGCKVTISKFVMPPGKVAQPNLAPQLQGGRQTVPPRYSDAVQTTLSVTVPEQGGRFDFPLTSVP